MAADTAVVRTLARQVRERAGEVRVEADALARLSASVPWSGLAADAMRRLAHDQADWLRRCAEAHEAAAEALDRHAREVDHHRHLLVSLGHRLVSAL